MDRLSWFVFTSPEFRQHSLQRQFILGGVERSHELRIDRRVIGAIGRKVTIAADRSTRS